MSQPAFTMASLAALGSFTAQKSGPLSVLDTQLTGLYLGGGGGGAALSGTSAKVVEAARSFAGSVTTGSDGQQYAVIDFTAKDGDGAALLAQLDALGLQHGSSYGAMASGLLRVDQIGSLLGVENLAFARESVSSANAGLVTTQADHAQHDDIARAGFGVDGTGLKIGILSDSFDTSGDLGPDGQPDTMASNIASGDLPANTTVLQDFANGTDEGRAMAQLVHDIAPGAAIEFASANYGQAGFANNIVALAADGAQVIVDDVFYYFEPAYQNGVIAQAVNYVHDAGVTYFSSAGNQGFGGFESAWHASADTAFGEALTDFAPGQSYLEVTATGGQDIITLHWDEPSASAGGPGSQSDIDMFLVDGDGNLIAYSADNNIDGDPVEGFAFVGNPGETYYLLVGLYSGAAPTDIKLVDYSGTGTLQDTEYNFNSGTILGHAAAVGAISVAAADYRATPAYGTSPAEVEDFSSGGPTVLLFDDAGNRLADPIIVYGPDITAVDGGNTTFFYPGDNPDQDAFPNFYGTSAAAPDAAATALLMLQANLGLTLEDIRALLIDSALDLDNPLTTGFDTGYDDASGAGLIQADQAVYFAKTLSISNAQATELYGTHFGDAITGGNGVNFIDGADGNDTLDGGLGGDFVVGGAGNDVADGGGGDDAVYGEDGNDSLYGNAGADDLYGGAGNDTIRGGDGDDLINGGDGIDTAAYQFIATGVTVDLTQQGVGQATGLGQDTLISIENLLGGGYGDTFTGDAGNNVLDGFRGDDKLYGGGGDDTLDGGGGADTLKGGAGNDEYHVDNTGVTVFEAAGAGHDVVFTTLSSYTLGANLEDLVFQGASANFTGTGNALANAIVGGDGNDSLFGGNGSDTLFGSYGHDVLTGGAQGDTFLFAGPDAGSDEVVDFSKFQGDHVGLGSGFGITSIADVDFVSGPTATPFEGKATLVYTSGDLYWDADGNGAGARVLLAHFDGTPALALSDFLVV